MPRLSIGLEQVFTDLGIVGDGYKMFFFDTETMIPKTTYSDQDLTIQNTNPVVLNEAGRPDVDIWGSDPSLYRMILGTPDSVLGNISIVVDVDPVDNYNVDNIAGLMPIPTAYWGTTDGTSTNYTLDPALVNITSYSNTQTFFIDFHIACGANPDIDINDLGTLDLKKYTGQGTKVGLLEGDVQSQRHLCINDGTDIVVLNPRTQMLYLGAPPTLTVATNTLTLTNVASSYLINTGSGAQIINTINGLASGQTATIGISSNSNSATFSTGVGNVINPGGFPTVLASVNDKLSVYNDGTNVLITGVSSGTYNPIQLIETKTASNSATIDFSTGITSAFSKYIIELINVTPATDAVYLGLRYSVDGGANFLAASYVNTAIYNAATVGDDSGTTDRIVLTDDGSASANRTVDNGAANGVDGKVEIANPASSTKYKTSIARTAYQSNADGFVGYHVQGRYEGVTTAINAFRILFSNGNIASGILKLYGVK